MNLCKRSLASSLALSSVLALVACTPEPAKPLPPPPAAKITSFTASAVTVPRAGDSVTLSWTTTDATSISVEHVGKGPLPVTETSGTASVVIDADAFFVLTARGEGGTDSRALGVRLAAQASTVLFSALPSRIDSGESTTLVWSAPGAQAVSLRAGTTQVDIGAQKESGAVAVSPARTTTYELTVDGQPHTVEVSVRPVISTFMLAGPAPEPGGSMKVAWTTRGADKITLTRAGVTMPLLTETDAAKVAAGDFTDSVAANAPIDSVIDLTLEAEGAGGAKVSKPLTVRVGRIDAKLNVSGYAKVGQAFQASWTTVGAESVELRVDGRPLFIASSQAEVNAGNQTLVGKSTALQLELIARNTRGAETRVMKTIEPVGMITFNSFTATPTTVATGGTAVALAWDVSNARRVRISQVGGGFNAVRTGAVDTGTVMVKPNRTTVTYRLEADNQAGDAITPQDVVVTVTAPAVVTVSRKLPLGGATQITGTTLSGATSIAGLPLVTSNAAGEAFVDIAPTGTEVTDFAESDDASALIDFGGMDLRLFGVAVTSPAVSVSTNGWLYFSTANDASDRPTTPTVGSSLRPLALSVFGRDLDLGTEGTVHWRTDTVGGLERLIVQWTNVEVWADPGTRLTFQAQVFSNGKVVYAYKTMERNGAAFSVAVVNRDETGALAPSTLPAAGETVSFFAPVAVSSLPLAHTVQPSPYYAAIEASGVWLEALLDDALRTGDLSISEINPRPLAALTNAEWIEIANNTATPIELQDWTLATGTLTHTIASSVIVPANGRALLAQTADLGDGATATVAYQYPTTFVMANTGTLSLRPPASTAAWAQIDWTAGVAAADGVAVRADAPSADFRYASSFTAPTCAATGTGTYGTSNQTGTPGAGAARCFPYALERLPAGSFTSIAGTGTLLVAASAPASDESVFPVALPQGISYFGASYSTIYVSTNGWISTTSTTAPTATNKSSPTTSAPVGSIAPYWDTLIGEGAVMNGGLFWEQRDPDMTPASGDELTIVSWEGFRYNSSTYAGQFLEFQVKFFANGNIEYHVGRQQTTSTLLRGGSATTWLESPNGTAALTVNVNSSSSPGIQANTGFLFRYLP